MLRTFHHGKHTLVYMMSPVLSSIFVGLSVKKKIVILPGCIGCGLCEALAPNIFDVTDISRVKEGVEYKEHEQIVQQVIASCPLKVIVLKDCDKE